MITDEIPANKGIFLDKEDVFYKSLNMEQMKKEVNFRREESKIYLI
jgi:hypothetical protein